MDRNRVTIRRHHRRPGQARKSLWIETSFPSNCIIPIQGQARKSLWIETRISSRLFFKELGQARKSLWIETGFNGIGRYDAGVRLVRACGSKLTPMSLAVHSPQGQARKSLWIETENSYSGVVNNSGQARKSLWIETNILRIVSQRS